MRIWYLFLLAGLGIVAGAVSVYVYRERINIQPPLSQIANPYSDGIYASGIIEGLQPSGQNVSLYPEIAGTVAQIFVQEGERVKTGDPLVAIDDSLQRAELEYAIASTEDAVAQFDKLQKAYTLNQKAVSLNALDNALYAVKIAEANQQIAQATLDKCMLYAPNDAEILSINVAPGAYIAPVTGTYNNYTDGESPVVTLAPIGKYLAVRCYVDEILIPRLPDIDKLGGTLFIRGTTGNGIPLEFVRVQPNTIPKIQLSDEVQERVDVRVLPIIFKFKKPQTPQVYPGQLVDIYIQGKE